jgi:type I restriction enzyme R subunit
VEVIEDIWQNRDRDYNIRRLVKRLHRIDKQMSAEAREMFAAYIPAGDLAKYAKELPAQLRKNFTGAMTLLRDLAFQDLLMNYPRAPHTFLIAYETQGGYARHGPSALTSRAPNPGPIVFDNLIGELG